MTLFSIRAISMGALAFATMVAGAAAQTPSPILNDVEVRRLVASEAPADHTRLSGHFTALADRYSAEARKHEAMARAGAGNPNRNTSAGMSAHCRRLAELNTESASTLRELATHH